MQPGVETRSRTSSTSSNTSKRSLDHSGDRENERAKLHKMSTEEITKLSTEVKQMHLVQKTSFDTLTSTMKGLFEDVKTSLSAQINAISENMKRVEENVSKVEESVKKANFDITTLRDENEMLRSQLNHQEQLNMIRSFNVFGLPTLPPNSAQTVMRSLATHLGTTINLEDFKELFVVNHRNKKTSHITGTFYEEKKRDEIFFRMKHRVANKKPIVVEDIITTLPKDSTFRGKEIRVRTKVTQHTRKLLNDAYQYKNTFKFIWESDGRVLMRKDENSRIVEIKTEQQLVNIAAGHNPTPTDQERLQH